MRAYRKPVVRPLMIVWMSSCMALRRAHAWPAAPRARGPGGAADRCEISDYLLEIVSYLPDGAILNRWPGWPTRAPLDLNATWAASGLAPGAMSVLRMAASTFDRLGVWPLLHTDAIAFISTSAAS